MSAMTASDSDSNAPNGAPSGRASPRLAGDLHIVQRLCAGDPEAGREFDRQFRWPLVRFCAGYLGSVEVAQDAVQDIFCKLLSGRQTPDRFRAWLYRVARNHCLNAIRDRRRRGGLPLRSDRFDPQTTHVSRLSKRELRSHLRHVVDALPLMYREPLCLRYVEGLSRGEIAEVLELPVSVVKSRLFEGLKKLREHTSLLHHY